MWCLFDFCFDVFSFFFFFFWTNLWLPVVTEAAATDLLLLLAVIWDGCSITGLALVAASLLWAVLTEVEQEEEATTIAVVLDVEIPLLDEIKSCGCRLWKGMRLRRAPFSVRTLDFPPAAVDRPLFLHLKANLAHFSE